MLFLLLALTLCLIITSLIWESMGGGWTILWGSLGLDLSHSMGFGLSCQWNIIFIQNQYPGMIYFIKRTRVSYLSINYVLPCKGSQCQHVQKVLNQFVHIISPKVPHGVSLGPALSKRGKVVLCSAHVAQVHPRTVNYLYMPYYGATRPRYKHGHGIGRGGDTEQGPRVV